MKKMIPVVLAALVALPFSAFAKDEPTQPGNHPNLHCVKNPRLTYDIYLPKAYAEKPQTKFPAVFFAGRVPRWLGLVNWAEDNGIVLVSFNDVKNGDWAPIFASQDGVLESMAAYRIHPTLRFATGLSGGGWSSVKLSQRHPREIAGVLLQCHSGNGDIPAAGCRVAFVGGTADNVHPVSYIRAAAEKMRKAGRVVQEEYVPSGHTWAPPAVLARMLSNMLFHARMTAAGVTSEERREAEAMPAKVLAAASGESDPEKACAMISPLLDLTEFKSKPFYSKALDAWCESRAKSLAAMPDAKAAFAAYADETVSKRFADAPTPAVKQLLRKFSADAALKGELAAFDEFCKLRDIARQAAKRSGYKPAEWSAKFKKFADKHPGTVAAGLALKS